MKSNGNTRKAKTMRVSHHRMPDYKKCALSFLLKLVMSVPPPNLNLSPKSLVTAAVCSMKFTWKRVPLCWTAERKPVTCNPLVTGFVAAPGAFAFKPWIVSVQAK